MRQIADVVSRNIAWLQTMRQKDGYAGPVVHYWRDSLNYIGPGMDWRYEGVIPAFVTLFEKTKNEYFLNLAVEAGNHLLKNQLPSGNFVNSNFESNPSFRGGATPHEPAACIGLLTLAKKLGELDRNWETYFAAAKKNMDEYLLKILWDEKNRTFFQYRYDKKTHVPNKIATITEFLLLLYQFTGEKHYLEYAAKNADFIVSLQDRDEFYGGIYQSDEKNKLITFYIARCIPALVKVFRIVKEDKYLEGALDAAEFIKKMETRDGGFYFGYIRRDDEPKLHKYPIWAAGSGDIVRAFRYVAEYKNYDIAKNIDWILANVDDNGGIRTSYGINRKNELGSYHERPSWRDVLHVVGWNDKSLRLLAELIDEDTQIDIEKASLQPIEIRCSDAVYYEDMDLIKVNGVENHYFNKRAVFSKYDLVKRTVMRFGIQYTKLRISGYGPEKILYSKLK